MIIFDFDHVLFNTPLVKEDLRHVFERYNIKNQEFWKSLYKSYDIDPKIKGTYNLDRHLKIISGLDVSQKKSLKKDIEVALHARGQGYLYSDVLPVLAKLKDLGVETVLITKGDKNFKELELEVTGIADYFNEIYCTDKDIFSVLKKVVVTRNGEILFISDNLDLLRSISKVGSSVFCVYICREDQVDPKEPLITTVKSLNDLTWQMRTLAVEK